MLTISAGASIGSGGIFLIANNNDGTSRLAIDADLVDASVSLANTQLLLKLFDSDGSLMDVADDGIGAPFAGSTSPFASMERINLTASGQLKTNWKTATTFLNFDDGAAIYGTPKAKNGAGPSVDVFPPKEAMDFAAEIMPDTSTGSVETPYGSTTLTTGMASLHVSWTPSISLDLSHQTLLWSGTGVTLPKTATGISLAGIGTGVTFTLRSTDALGNTSTGVTTISRLFPDVKITEVLANPAGVDDGEWIEIGNLGKEAVDIGGWILDEENSSGDFPFPSPLSLQPNEHRIFRKSVTGLPLQNNGETVTLKRGFTVMDSWKYSETAEEVSFGRGKDDLNIFRSFCVPTPNKPNDMIAPEPLITIQSGDASGEKSVTLNLVAMVLTGSTAHASCSWNYGDGFTSGSCNPPSHTFGKTGTYEIRLTYRDFCANTAEKSITATVLPSSANGGNTGGSKQSGGTGGGSSGGESGNRTSCMPSHFEGIRLSEFLPDPEGKDEEGEWIELENTLSENVSLCGWELDDAEGGSRPFILDTFLMAPKSFLLLERPLTKIALNNSNESIRLFKPGKTLIEEIAYGDSNEAESYALRSDGLFVWTPFPTPAKENHFREVSVKSPGASAVISAVLPNPDGKDEGNEWIEVTNAGKTAVDLKGWQLDHSKGGSPYTIAGGILEPKSVRRFLDSVTGITLTNTKDEARLLDPSGNIVSLIHWANAVSGRIYRPSEEEKKEFAATGSGATASGSALSGSTLIVAMSGAVETPPSTGSGQAWASPSFNPFNEIMSNPAKEGPLHDLGEYLELKNPTDETVTLEGWILDDDPLGSSKPKKLNEKYVIEPNSYLLLCKNDGCDLPLSISLNNEGEELSLTSPDGAVIFAVTYPELERGEAYALDDNAWCVTGTITPSAENICRTPVANQKPSSPGCRGVAGGACPEPGRRAPTATEEKTDTKKTVRMPLRIKYRHIYAPEDHAEEIPKDLPPLLHALLPKTERRKMNAIPSSPLSDAIARLALISSFGSLSLFGTLCTRRKASLL